jgi:EAL domain-containing protein (putative c-di-GMP-specific phosphodiesterase class I)
MQGYLFSMPVPASKIHSLLAEQARMLAELGTVSPGQASHAA